MLEEGLSLLQTLDPAGVGARDLSQCLELQLRRRGEEGTALAIVQRGLERLARGSTGPSPRNWASARQEVLPGGGADPGAGSPAGAAFAP